MSALINTETTDTTIAEAASTRGEFSVLATVVKAAQLVDTLASPGPFTVFAPTDAAFSKLPHGEIDRMLKPENRVMLSSFVASHIFAGHLTVAELRARVHANSGHLTLRNVDNDTIQIEQRDERLHLHSARGACATVTGTDLLQSNGVIHATDAVLFTPAC